MYIFVFVGEVTYLASFYDFYIKFWNCSDSVVFCDSFYDVDTGI